MSKTEALTDLLAKVKAGEWCGFAAIAIWPQGRVKNGKWVHEFSMALRAFEGSLDAAKTLKEAVLSDRWTISIVQRIDTREKPEWHVRLFNWDTGQEATGDADDEGRAATIAILGALISMEKNDE